MAERLSLPAQPLSVRQARRFVSDYALAHGFGELRAPAELLTSEVVTNAIVHTGTDISVSVTADNHRLRIEVTDGARAPLPVSLETIDAETMGGRGLRLVAMIAAQWGVEPAEQGKIVWFELSADSTGAL